MERNLLTELHNRKTLANVYGWPYRTFLKKLKSLLQDSAFATEFGELKGYFTPKQLKLLIEELGEPILESTSNNIKQ